MAIEQIGEIMGLASTALGLTGKAASTAATIKGLLDKGDGSDNKELAELLNSLAAQLTSANMMNVQLSEDLRSLSRELRRHDEFEKQKARYVMFETGEKDIVFRLREDVADGEPIHFICPVCLRRDSLISNIVGEGDFKVCHTNRDHLFRFESRPIRQPKSNRSRFM